MKTLKIFLFNLVVCLSLTGCFGDEENAETANTPTNLESHVAEPLNDGAIPSDPVSDEAVPTDVPEFKPLFASAETFQKLLADHKCKRFLNLSEEEALKLSFDDFGIARTDYNTWVYDNQCIFIPAKDLKVDDAVGTIKPWQDDANNRKVKLPITYLSRASSEEPTQPVNP